jgi:hypothetical protein
MRFSNVVTKSRTIVHAIAKLSLLYQGSMALTLCLPCTVPLLAQVEQRLKQMNQDQPPKN